MACSAHKVANPEAHRIREDVRELLPSLKGIEEKHGPTRVHLQVYDGMWGQTVPRSLADSAKALATTSPCSR